MLSVFLSCKKSDITPAESVCSFKVNNQSNNTIAEGKILQLSNQSANAVSYHWDFGNGLTSDKENPEFYYPIHGEYMITLTVTDAKGKSSKSSYSLTVLCNIFNPNHNPLTGPVM